MFELNKDYISRNNVYERQNQPKYIVIHETDNFSSGANAKRHAVAQYSGHLDTSVHYYCGDDGVYQVARHEDGTYSIGREYGGDHYIKDANNRNTINIEICVNQDGDYSKARNYCIELVKELISTTGIPVSNVVRHYDVKGKYCPRKMLAEPSLWEDFKKRINSEPYTTNIITDLKYGTVITQTDPLNVRENPHGKIIGKLEKGARVEVLRKIDEWLEINFNGGTAYVFANYVELCQKEESVKRGICTGNYVRLRKTPEFTDNVIEHVMRNWSLQILATQGVWCYVQLNDGLKGWMYSDYVKVYNV